MLEIIKSSKIDKKPEVQKSISTTQALSKLHEDLKSTPPIPKTRQKAQEEFDSTIEKSTSTLESETKAEKITEKEYLELPGTMPEILGGNNPEITEYLKSLNPRVENFVEEMTKEENLDKKITKITAFLKTEEKNLKTAKLPKQIKDQILASIAQALDIEKIEEEISHKSKMELLALGLYMVPGVGSLTMYYEAAKGKTISGDKLSAGKRALHVGVATLYAGLDIAALFSMGATEGIAEGAKAAEVGVKGAKGAKAAVEGAKVVKTIKRFAALLRATKKGKKLARVIYKSGKIIEKSPKLVSKLGKASLKRKEMKDKVKVAGKIWKSSKKYRKLKRKLRTGQKIAKKAQSRKERQEEKARKKAA